MAKKNTIDYEPRYFDPRNDVAFKKVFQDHEDLTKSFLNATLRLQGEKSISKVEYLPTERLPMTSESKKSILDVLCTDHRGFQYIIEVQNKYMQNYLQRAQYYVSHVYAGQLGEGKDYIDLKRVTLLSVLNHNIFPPQLNYLSFHENIEVETKESYLNDMSYVFIELPKFTKPLGELKTPEDYWIFTMKEATQLQEVPADAPEEVKKAYQILERHTWTRQERLAYEQARMALLDDRNAIATARKEGKEEGKGEGKEEGRKEEKLALAKHMLLDQEPIEKIIRWTGLSKEEIETLAPS